MAFAGGNNLKKEIVLLVLFVLIGTGIADSEENYIAYENPTTIEEDKLTFNMEQSVSGTGFFAAYKYSQMPDVLGEEGQLYNGVEAKNTAHGSGEIDIDSLIYAESSYRNRTWADGAYDEDGNFVEDEEETTSLIQMNDESKMTYTLISMAVGQRHYASHPVAFNSMLSENLWIKNRGGLNSISHKVEGAHGIGMSLDAQSDATLTSMKVKEDLISGKARFGALQLAEIPHSDEPDEEDSEISQAIGQAVVSWQNPVFELEQDYVGSYHLETNLNLHACEEEEEAEEDRWLPCCSGGFQEMDSGNRAERSVQDVFDCTCLKPLKGAI